MRALADGAVGVRTRAEGSTTVNHRSIGEKHCLITIVNDGGMLLRQLQYLEALSREEHFGRAADACHVSQPALSNGIAKLEEELGLGLVQRGRQFEGLTPEGRAVLEWARAALASVDGLEQEASRLRDGLAGTLRIGVIPTAAARLGQVLGAFMREQPAVRIELVTAPTTQIVDQLGRRELDAGLVYTDDPLPSTAPLLTIPLYRERLLLLTSDARWQASHGTVTWAEAAAVPLCLLAPSMQNRQVIDRAFRKAGVTQVQVRAEADSIVALLELGGAGSSCIVADAWLDGRALPPGVRVHGLASPTVSPTVGLITAQGPLVAPTVRALRERLSRSA